MFPVYGWASKSLQNDVFFMQNDHHDFIEKSLDNFSYLDELDITDEIKQSFKELIIQNFKQEAIKLYAKLAMVSNSPQGINVVKNVLLESEKNNPDFTYYLDSTPYYNIEIVTNKIDEYNNKLKEIVNNIHHQILSNNGQFKLAEKSY